MVEERIIPTAKFAPLSRTGEIAGLSKAQLGLVLVALSWPVYLIVAHGDLGGAMRALFVWTLPVGVLAAGSIGGRSFLSIATLNGTFVLRKLTGQTKYLPRIRVSDYKKGKVKLPGAIGERAHFVEMRGIERGLGAGGIFVYDALAGKQTATAVIRVDSESWLNADDQEKANRAYAESEFCKRVASIKGIKRVSHYARTYEVSRNRLPAPDQISANSKVGELARIDHHELTNLTQLKTPVRRDVVIAITLSEKDSKSDIDSHGGGVLGTSRVLADRVAMVLGMLEDCGARYTDGKWMGKEDLWGAIRLAFEPTAGPWLDENNHQQPIEEPVSTWVEEFFTYLQTAEGFHRTYYMEKWPTTETEAGFLYPLIAEGDVPRTVTQIWEPENTNKTEKNVNNLLTSRGTVERINTALGRRASINHRVEAADLALQQHEMMMGYPNVRYSAWVTVHARSKEELQESSLWVHNAARRIHLRPFHGGHARAFATAAVPLGYRDADL